MKRLNLRIKPWIMVAVALMAGVLIVFASSVQAALPAPNWLPGQPMLAGTQVIAMWLPVPGAIKYIVYLDGQKIMETPANQYFGAAPEKAGQYRFEVTAVDAAGAESPRSVPGLITIAKIEPPSTPVFRTDNTEQSVVIRWQKPAGAVIYNLYRAAVAGGPYQLLVSQQDETYKDTGLEFGKTYYYVVTAKDITGKESDKSPEIAVPMEKPKEAVKAVVNDLVIVPTKLRRDFFSIGEYDLSGAQAIAVSPGGSVFLFSRTNFVFELDPASMTVVGRYFFDRPEGVNKPLELWTMAFIDNNLAWISDLANGALHKAEVRKGRILETVKLRKPTIEENKRVFESMKEWYRVSIPNPVALAVLSDGRILVSDTKGNIMHLLDENGELIEWFVDINEKSPAGDVYQRPLNACGDMVALDDGTVLLGFPTDRRVIRLNVDTKDVLYTIGQSATMVGNFIGVRGITMLGKDRVVVSDGTMHTIQVFDVKTGQYLFSFGGPQKVPDQAQTTRPLVDFQAPLFGTVVGPDHKQLLLFQGFLKYWHLRDILEPMPEYKGVSAAK